MLGDPTIDLQRTGPKLSYSPTSHDFKEKEKGITDSTSFEIWNSNTETLTFSLSTECNWVSISPESGSSTEGEKKTINVTIDTSNLDYGINNCDINIESDGGTTGVFEVSVNVVSRKPDVPTNPDPANGSTGVDNNPFLKIDVSDPVSYTHLRAHET